MLAAVDTSSSAYQGGQLIASVLLFVVGTSFFLSGLQARRTDGRRDGTARIAIGASVLGLLVLSLLGSWAGSVADARKDPSEPRIRSEDDFTSELYRPDRFLRSIDELQLRGKGPDRTRFTISYSGDDSSGSLSSADGRIDFRRVDGRTYVDPSDEFWRSTGNPGNIPVIDGRWIRVTQQDSAFGGIVRFVDRRTILGQLDARQRFTRQPSRSIDGTDCLVIRNKVSGSTLYIAEDRPRLLRIVERDGSTSDIDYDASVTPPRVPDRVVASADIFG